MDRMEMFAQQLLTIQYRLTAANIKAIRKRANQTQKEFVKACKIRLSVLEDLEGGTREPNLRALKKIAKHTGLTTDELMGSMKVGIPENME